MSEVGEGQQRHPYSRKPKWLRVQLTQSAEQNKSFKRLQSIMRSKNLHTVCEEARCPNIHECWGEHATATFMVLGDTCTRRCRFCSVKTGLPRGIDMAEPDNVGQSVAEMGLRHVVITMVNRDDLSDGGAAHVVATVRAIRRHAPSCTVEVLSSDLMGDRASIEIMMGSEAEIMSHNIETVRRLTPRVRSRSKYRRSLEFLRTAKEIDPRAVTKSSIMLGLGEGRDEVLEAMDDLLAHEIDILNLGQYLQPTRAHLAVQRWWTPDEFNELRAIALEKGFRHCEAGALVRSSYHADAQYAEFRGADAARAGGAGANAARAGDVGAGAAPSAEAGVAPSAEAVAVGATVGAGASVTGAASGRGGNAADSDTPSAAMGRGARQRAAAHPLYRDRELAAYLLGEEDGSGGVPAAATSDHK